MIRHVLGAMMTATNSAKSDGPSLLHAVALLTDLPEQRLARGQVGTIVEELDETTLLVEFSDDECLFDRTLPAGGPAGPALRP